MKLSTFAIAITLSVASLQAVAQNVVLKPVSDNFETQVCYTAATEGYNAAKRLARREHVNFAEIRTSVSCNGISIKEFAELYEINDQDSATTTVALVAKNSNVESQACLAAIDLGETAAKAKYGLEGETVFCNYEEMATFAKKYRNDSTVIQALAD